MATITLTLEVTEEERANLMARFIATASAVAGDDDEGKPGDPNGSKIDGHGVVWDARYHGVNMAKNQDGTWRRKKGLSEQEKADADTYEAGCRNASTAAHAAAGVPATTVALQQTTQPAAPAPDVPAFLQTGTFAPAAAAAPVMGLPGMPVAAPTPPAPQPVSYPELINAFQATIARVGQPIVDANLSRIYTEAGVTAEAGGLALLETSEDARRKVKEGLDALQAG